MTTVLLTSPFIPAEWVAAHGLIPLRLAATSAGECCQAGRCAIAAGSTTLPAEAVVAVTSCDQARRAFNHDPRPVFTFTIPATWQGALPARIYREELHRLSRFLIRLGGIAPSAEHLVATILAADARRQRLRSLLPSLPARQAAELLALEQAGTSGTTGPHPLPLRPSHAARPGICLLGGPLPRSCFDLFDDLEDAGLRLACDGSELGERGLAPALDRRTVRDDPLGALVEAYFLGLPDAFRRPDSLLFTWLETLIPARQVAALVVLADPWCDPWRAAAARLRDWNRLPVQLLDTGCEPGSRLRRQTRLQALAELLAGASVSLAPLPAGCPGCHP